MMIRMGRVGKRLAELSKPPIIALQIFLVFRINSFELTIKGRGKEEGANEELGEAI